MTHDELLALIRTVQSLQSETGDLDGVALWRGVGARDLLGGKV